MLNSQKLINFFKKQKINFFFGVPDSVLKNFLYELDKEKEFRNLICANEGTAVSTAIGNYLKTKKLNIVYLQNSGLGNAINPLISIATKKVYSIPLVLLIGWRGYPGSKDEPQHQLQGMTTTTMLDQLKIKYKVIRNYKDLKNFSKLISHARKKLEPVALIIKKLEKKKIIYKNKNKNKILRVKFIEALLNLKIKSFIVSATGYTSRELNYVINKKKLFNQKVFYMVGGMGHASSVSLGYSLMSKKNVICLDGDGSCLMHLGALVNCGYFGKSNYKYFLLNNFQHESVGGQKTLSNNINFKLISKGLNFKKYFLIKNEKNLEKQIHKILTTKGPVFAEVMIKSQTISNLTRPSNFQKLLKKNFK